MALPFFYPFKTRVLQATTTATAATNLVVCVPHRGRLDNIMLSYGFVTAQSAQATVDFVVTASGLTTTAAITPTTISGLGSAALLNAVTTTTGGTLQFFPTAATYVNPGDILQLLSTGTAAPSVSWIIKEF